MPCGQIVELKCGMFFSTTGAARHPKFSRTKKADFTHRVAPENMQIHAKIHGTWPNSRLISRKIKHSPHEKQ